MFKFDSYAHSVMINFFEKILITSVIIVAAYYINEMFGDIVYIPGAIYMAYTVFDAMHKVLDTNNWDKNCWYKGGK